jgi:Cu(I)/Ag(I) efflux system membrane fusion protein
MISKWIVALLILASLLGSLQSHAAGEDADILYWTCGMHPSVKAEESGKCPICNMDLVPVMKETETTPAEGKPIELNIGEEAARLARISTALVTRMMLTLSIDAPGELAYDETRTAVISSRVGGWIEKLYADETGMELGEGDPLIEIYSPELVSAQKEYLLARGTELEAHAMEKLLLLGLTKKQVRELHEESDISTTLTIFASAAGTVVHRGVTSGERIEAGRTLFHIADLSRLWVLADIFENDIGLVRKGQEARITVDALQGVEIESSVAFIEPATNPRTRSTRIRLEIENPDSSLRPGMFAKVRIEAPMGGMEEGSGDPHRMHMQDGGVLAVPRGAIINTGRRTIAFVETGPGRYLLRKVKLGVLAGDHYVVLDGLSEGERVVERGSFLLDSQAQLSGQAEEIYGGALGKESEKVDPHSGHIH